MCGAYSADAEPVFAGVFGRVERVVGALEQAVGAGFLLWGDGDADRGGDDEGAAFPIKRLAQPGEDASGQGLCVRGNGMMAGDKDEFVTADSRGGIIWA